MVLIKVNGQWKCRGGFNGMAGGNRIELLAA
jgi:hypothetical protein